MRAEVSRSGRGEGGPGALGPPSPGAIRPSIARGGETVRAKIGTLQPPLEIRWTFVCAPLLVPVEVARRLLLEPQAVVLGRLLEEVRRLLEHVVIAAARRLQGLVGGDLVAVLLQPRILLRAGRRRVRVGRRRVLVEGRLGVRRSRYRRDVVRLRLRELVAAPRTERLLFLARD